jgi:hypothetical protein
MTAAISLPQQHADEEKDREIAVAGRTLFMAAVTIIVGSFVAALVTYALQLKLTY